MGSSFVWVVVYCCCAECFGALLLSFVVQGRALVADKRSVRVRLAFWEHHKQRDRCAKVNATVFLEPASSFMWLWVPLPEVGGVAGYA